MGNFTLRFLQISLGVLAFGSIAFAQPFRQGYVNTFRPEPAADRTTTARAVTSDRQGNTVYAGVSLVTTAPGNFDRRVFVRKLNSLGAVAWTTTLDHFPSASDAADTFTVLANTAGEIYVSYSVVGPLRTRSQFGLTKLSANGAVLWRREFAPTVEASVPYAAGLDSQGNVFQAGGNGSNARFSWLTVKWSPAGVRLWSSVWRAVNATTTGDHQANALTVTPTNDVVVAGYATRTGSALDSAIVRFRGTDGAKTWERVFGGNPGFGNDESLAVSIATNGDVLATGNEYVAGSVNYLYAARLVGATGAVSWKRNLVLSAVDSTGVGILSDSAGNVFVGGHARIAFDYDLIIIKYNSGGTQQWLRRQDGGNTKDDDAASFAMDQLGNMYLAGTNKLSSTSNRLFTMKLTPANVVAWSTRYQASATSLDTMSQMAMDRTSGNVMVVSPWQGLNTTARLVTYFQPPVARDDSYNTRRNTLLTTNAPGFLTNDVFRSGATVTRLTNPASGVLTFNATGAFTYAPATNFTGTVTFRYRLSRSGMTPSDATVTIRVVP